MHLSSARKLVDMPPEVARDLINSFDAILLDCDGVLWHEDTGIPGSADTVQRLKDLGKRVYFVTNNSVKTRHEVWLRARNLGFAIDEADIVAPLYAIGQYLRNNDFRKKAYVIGGEAIIKELDQFGIEHLEIGPDVLNGKVSDFIQDEIIPMNVQEVGAVIVGFDEHFSYPKMMRASHYLASNDSCLFIVTNADPVQRYPKYYIPGTGALLNAIETCVGRSAMLFGKPESRVCDHLVREGLIVPERTLMIGDCCRVDVPFGKNCGFATILVGSGNTDPIYFEKIMEDITGNQDFIPDYYMTNLCDLLKFL